MTYLGTDDGETLTREQIARDVMIAMIHATAKDMIRPSAKTLASEAVRYTDALIAELNKEQGV